MSDAEPAARILPLVDLTSLGDDDTDRDVEALCTAATTPFGSVAAVCVWPRFVALAANRLADGPVKVAAVANFPHGAVDIALAVADAVAIIEAGGSEVDVVYPWRALAAGQIGAGAELVAATRAAIGSAPSLKVILETGELADPALISAAAIEALDAGADFLKTSTGKTEHGASEPAARILLETARDRGSDAGVKISGGVRTVAQAAPYLALADEVMGPNWVTPATFRFGASSLLEDVCAVLARQDGG